MPPHVSIAIAAYPRSFHVFTHLAKAVPPPPCTSTMAGTLQSARAPSGSPHHAKMRVGLPFNGSPSMKIGSTPAIRP